MAQYLFVLWFLTVLTFSLPQVQAAVSSVKMIDLGAATVTAMTATVADAPSVASLINVTSSIEKGAYPTYGVLYNIFNNNTESVRRVSLKLYPTSTTSDVTARYKNKNAFKNAIKFNNTRNSTSSAYVVLTNNSDEPVTVGATATAYDKRGKVIGSDKDVLTLSGSATALRSDIIAGSDCYTFTRYLGLGSSGEDVVVLQTFLKEKGFLTLAPSEAAGYYGESTWSAVRAYQTSVGIPATGYVGPITMAKLNSECLPVPATTFSIISVESDDSLTTTESPYFKNAIGREKFDNSTAEPDEGFHVQAYIYDANDPNPKASLQGINATFDYNTKSWSGEFQPITTVGKYRMDIILYCSIRSLVCGQRYGYPGDDQFTHSVLFTVSSSTPNLTLQSVNWDLVSVVSTGVQYRNPRVNFGTVDSIPFHDNTTAKKWCQSVPNKGYTDGVSTVAGTNPQDGLRYRAVSSSEWAVEQGGNYPRYYTCSTSTTPQTPITVSNPQQGDVYDNGPTQNVIVGWQKYTGDFDYYVINVGNTVANVGKRISGAISKESTGFTTTSGVIQDAISKLSGKTAPEQGYYFDVFAVKVDAAGEGNVATGKSGTFSIVSTQQPLITVISPNGGETYKPGTTVNIKWASNSIKTDSVKIELGYSHTDKTYPGGTYIEDWLIESTPNTGSYNWTIPEYYATGILSSSFSIKISGGGVTDYSDRKFTIMPGPTTNTTISVLKPTASSVYSRGSSVPISWIPTSKGVQYMVSLLKKGDPTFVRSSLNTSGYSPNLTWEIPSDIQDGGDYLIKVTEGLYRNATGYSGTFSVKPAPTPSITVISPNGGEQMTIGQTYKFLWSSQNVSTPVDLYVISSDGTTKKDIAQGIYNTGSYLWTIPKDQLTGAHRFYVSSGSISDHSDSVFTITSLTLKSLNWNRSISFNNTYWDPRVNFGGADFIPFHDNVTATKWCQNVPDKGYTSGTSTVYLDNPQDALRYRWDGSSWLEKDGGDYPRYYVCK